jgi:hypothetical protein
MAAPAKVEPGKTVEIRLTSGQQDVKLTVTVMNSHEDHNCPVNLRISQALLTND